MLPFRLVNGIAWAPKGNYIATADTNKTVQIWDASTGYPMNTYLGHHREVVAVSWSPNGKYIVSGDDDGIVQVWRSLL